MDFQEGLCQRLFWVGRCGIVGRSWLARMNLEGGNNSSHRNLLHAWAWCGPFDNDQYLVLTQNEEEEEDDEMISYWSGDDGD